MHLTTLFEAWQNSNKTITIKVYGTSMYPVIKGGESISIQCVDPIRLKRGDLIVFRQDNVFITHRLVKKKRTQGIWWFCQKGDNLLGWSWIPQGDILGRVECIHGAHKRLVMNTWRWNFINHTVGFLDLFWVTVYETARGTTRKKGVVFQHMPVLSLHYRVFVRILHRVSGFITKMCMMVS